MIKSEASVANRVILFFFVVFSGAVFWLCAIGFVTEQVGISGNLKLWVGLVFGAAIAADRMYIKIFPVGRKEKTSDKSM